MRITGTLLDVQHNSGTFPPENGQPARSWQNVKVKVFDGSDVSIIKVNGDDACRAALAAEARKGQSITLDVDSVRDVQTRTFRVLDAPKS